jgi:hypothetical protein
VSKLHAKCDLLNRASELITFLLLFSGTTLLVLPRAIFEALKEGFLSGNCRYSLLNRCSFMFLCMYLISAWSGLTGVCVCSSYQCNRHM